MDRLAECIPVRIVPSSASTPIVFEDWSDVEHVEEPHIVLPARARIRRHTLPNGTVELRPSNPFAAIVVLAGAPGEKPWTCVPAADTTFTHAVMRILRDARR